jgi:hypothetical protein
MFQTHVGEVLTRIAPPIKDQEGTCHTGVVAEVTETEIVLEVQMDTVRHLRFFRRDGRDVHDTGTFLVRPAPTEPRGASALPEGWTPLPEDAEERVQFENAVARHGDARLALAQMLKIWGLVQPGGTYARQCFIAANEIVQLRTVHQLSQAQVATRTQALADSAQLCHDRANEYQRLARMKYHHLTLDAVAGALACEAGIRALVEGN